MATMHDHDATSPGLEETTTCHEVNELPAPRRKRTPLPKFQLFIVFLIQFAEPITASVIYPFINQFVRDTGVTGGDQRKTGYYAGIIESLFFFAEALTVYHWGRASDYMGRKPVLLIGPIGLAIGMASFGLSRTYWPLVVSRCLQGVFNGNIGVSKSVMAEITDSTNMADAFAMIPLMWSTGSTIGPMIGGLLSQPAKNWPAIFGKITFFHNYPYFLPCAVASSVALVSGLIASVGLKETLPSAIYRRQARKAAKSDPDSSSRLLSYENGPDYGSSDIAQSLESQISAVQQVKREDDVPPPFRALLVRQVLIPLSIYAFLAFTDMSCQVLQPLFYSTSISLGGLGFDPYRIGVVMGTWGFVNAAIQFTFLGRFLRKFGPKIVLVIAVISYISVLGMYPFLSYLARRAGRVDGKVWTLLVIQLMFGVTTSAGYAAIQIIVLDSAPSRAALGATNGMAQAVGSCMRSVAPSVASSLFSISLERRLLGGNMVFFIIMGTGLLGMRMTMLLPKHSRSQSH